MFIARILFPLSLVASLHACQPPSETPGGKPSTIDDRSGDGEPADADAGDSGNAGDSGDSGIVTVPLDGYGAISGECGVLDDEEWSSVQPFFYTSAIELTGEWSDTALLTDGGAAIAAAGNLNDGSLASEILAYEILYRCELATLLETEGSIVYQDPNGKKMDLLVDIDGHTVGVSVTRAYHWPPGEPMTYDEALVLLEGKLADMPVALANASVAHSWQRAVLSVVAYSAQHAEQLVAAYADVDAATKGDAIVLVTVTDGDDEFVF